MDLYRPPGELREEDGVAVSSRNSQPSSERRAVAPVDDPGIEIPED